MARRFFQPVHLAVIPEADGFRAAAINDTAEPVRVEAAFNAAAMDGTTRPLGQAAAEVGTESALTLAMIPADALRPGEVLAFRWNASNGMAGGEVVSPVRHKALDLRDPKIRLATETRGGALHARLRADALAFFVTLEADRPGRLSSKAVALFPGDDAEMTFTPDDGDPAGVTLTVRDLYSRFA